jgi:hypothetical protein
MIPNDFKGAAIPLSSGAIALAARELDIEYACLRAVDFVESRGNGFDSAKRPKILFERHTFRKRTNNKFDKTNPKVSGSPGGYTKNNEYSRLKEAMALDRTAALMSCSWGRYQIMGYNYKLAGYETLDQFVSAMCESEDNQLKAFINFLKSTKLNIPLKEKNFAKFARGYNGPNYDKEPGRDNDYDTRLAKAYNKFKLDDEAREAPREEVADKIEEETKRPLVEAPEVKPLTRSRELAASTIIGGASSVPTVTAITDIVTDLSTTAKEIKVEAEPLQGTSIGTYITAATGVIVLVAAVVLIVSRVKAHFNGTR